MFNLLGQNQREHYNVSTIKVCILYHLLHISTTYGAIIIGFEQFKHYWLTNKIYKDLA